MTDGVCDGETLRIAAIDLGTVSSRLLCAEVRDGAIVSSSKHTVITDLGEGVDALGVFSAAAVRRVADACAEFVQEARAFDAQYVCTTLTSAARDVSNGEELLSKLVALGLKPQVIPGEVEAALTFYGVAHDFPGRRIAVADSGGGSTELVVGAYVPGEILELERAQSLDIGCRLLLDTTHGGIQRRDHKICRTGNHDRHQCAHNHAGDRSGARGVPPCVDNRRGNHKRAGGEHSHGRSERVEEHARNP